MSKRPPHHGYWKANLLLVLGLLVIWFLVSCLLSIFFVEDLNEIKMGGFPLGFWIAQQGSILIFIVLTLVYVLSMKRLDQKHDVEETKN